MDAGAYVVPVLTESAQRMVGAATFSALASEPTKLSLWNDPQTPIPHVALGRKADVVVVCPATARVISDLRVGRAADLLTATLLATRAPVVIAPSMHTEMWEQQSVQENISVLAGRGVNIVHPVAGPLAGGDIGVGRMAEPSEIVTQAVSVLNTSTSHTGGSYAGRKVLVTAGGTVEPLDPVRFLGNRSSGKQGCAVAAEAAARGADTVLIATERAASYAPEGARVVIANTAADMASVVYKEAADSDVVVMAAAVADFRPAKRYKTKLKKDEVLRVPGLRLGTTLELEPTEDILSVLSERMITGGKVSASGEKVSAQSGKVFARQVRVGFAAETDNVENNAQSKLQSKKLHVMVANDVSKEHIGFESDDNEVTIFTSDGQRYHVQCTTKREVARNILDVVAGLMQAWV